MLIVFYLFVGAVLGLASGFFSLKIEALVHRRFGKNPAFFSYLLTAAVIIKSGTLLKRFFAEDWIFLYLIMALAVHCVASIKIGEKQNKQNKLPVIDEKGPDDKHALFSTSRQK